MNQIDNIMALHDAAVEREVEYREALRIDYGVREAGMKSAEADQAIRTAIEAALTPGEPVATCKQHLQVQEPVAWMDERGRIYRHCTHEAERANGLPLSVPIYTTPQPQPRHVPVAEFRGRRQTPEGTVEFWGVMLCDPMQDPPKGEKLYLGPVNDPVPADWRSVIPGGRYTDKWESARVGDFNEGWNTYRKAVITALSAAAPQPQRDDTALLRQALEALEACLGWPHVISALKERLNAN